MSDAVQQQRSDLAADEQTGPSFGKGRRHRQTGFLGVAAILIGIAGACAAFRAEVVGYSPVIAATGLAAGIIALFRATFLGRTTFGVPLLGMLVSFIGYGVAANNTHRLQGQYDHLRVWSKNRLPAMSLARFEPPRAAANAPGRPDAPVPPGAPVPDASPDTPAVTASPTPTPTPTPTPAPAATVPNPNDNSYFDLNRGWVNMKDASTRPAKGH